MPFELAHEVLGDDPGAASLPPLVLLHAFPFDRAMWRPAAALLSERPEPVILIDLPGLGASPLPPGEPSLAVAADGVRAVLDRLGCRQATVAGVSMGGYVAMELARRHRSRLAGLALIDTKAEADEPAARENRLRMAEAVLRDGAPVLAPMRETLLGATSRAGRPEVVSTVRSWLAAARPEGVAWSQRAMAARGDSHDVLSGLQVPATVVWGLEDEVSPQASAEAMADDLPLGLLVTVPAAGHLAALERPDAVAAALAELLDRAG